MFDEGGFFEGINASNLLGMGAEIYSKKESNKTQAEAESRRYESIKVQAPPANTSSPLNPKMLLYGGLGLGALVLVLVLKK